MQVGPQLFFWELQLFCCYLAVAASLLLPRLAAAALMLLLCCWKNLFLFWFLHYSSWQRANTHGAAYLNCMVFVPKLDEFNN